MKTAEELHNARQQAMKDLKAHPWFRGARVEDQTLKVYVDVITETVQSTVPETIADVPTELVAIGDALTY